MVTFQDLPLTTTRSLYRYRYRILGIYISDHTGIVIHIIYIITLNVMYPYWCSTACESVPILGLKCFIWAHFDDPDSLVWLISCSSSSYVIEFVHVERLLPVGGHLARARVPQDPGRVNNPDVVPVKDRVPVLLVSVRTPYFIAVMGSLSSLVSGQEIL